MTHTNVASLLLGCALPQVDVKHRVLLQREKSNDGDKDKLMMTTAMITMAMEVTMEVIQKLLNFSVNMLNHLLWLVCLFSSLSSLQRNSSGLSLARSNLNIK